MLQHLMLFAKYFKLGLSVGESYNLVVDHAGRNEMLEYGIGVGVNPCGLSRNKRESWEPCFRRHVRIQEAKISRWNRENNNQSIRRWDIWGEKVPEIMWPVNGTPYMPSYMRSVLSHVHDEEKEKDPVPVVDNAMAGRTLRDELLAQANAVKNGGNQFYR